eukprot:2286791-Rhodomonas_salina.2
MGLRQKQRRDLDSERDAESQTEAERHAVGARARAAVTCQEELPLSPREADIARGGNAAVAIRWWWSRLRHDCGGRVVGVEEQDVRRAGRVEWLCSRCVK